MSTLLVHRVCFHSSEEAEHPAKSLEQPGPECRGWVSRQFCIFPQTLTFQLTSRSHVSRIQLLFHHLLIPERVDLLVGSVPDGLEEKYTNAKFIKLGYVVPSANDRSRFQARELKSVTVDCEGSFIKLLVHRNHMNKHNLCNQVGLMGVAFFHGQSDNKSSVPGGDPTPRGRHAVRRDDLSFHMYMDQECVRLIDKLDKRKKIAAKSERFGYARNCKETALLLQQAGLRLGMYDMEKRAAIDVEDFEQAKLKRSHSDEYRKAVMRSLNVHRLLEEKGENQQNDIPMQLELPEPPERVREPTPTPPPAPPSPVRPPSDPLPPIDPPESRHDSGSSVAVKKPLTPPPPIDPPPQPVEEPVPSPSPPPAARPQPQNTRSRRPQPNRTSTLPALAGRKAMAGVMVGDVGTSAARSSPSSLTEQDRQTASLPIDAFGEQLVEKFYSKSFDVKEAGLHDLLATLRTDDGSVRADKKTRATSFLLQKMLKDKVYSIFQQATEILGFLIGPYATLHRTSRRELGKTMETTLPELLVKCGDNAPRVQSLAADSVVRMADVSAARDLPVVMTSLGTPLPSNIHPRAAQTRLDIVERLITKHGVSAEPNSRMSVQFLVDFVVSSLDHPSDTVRAAGSRLLLILYPENPSLVRRRLPADRIKRSTMTYRSLIDEMDAVDQKQKQKKGRPAPPRLNVDTSSEDSRDPDDAVRAGQGTALSRSVRGRSSMSVSQISLQDSVHERTCVFCGETSDKFATEAGMEYHFWRSCPILMRCAECRQVVEISAYTEHLLRECKEKSKYRACENCLEAIPKQNFKDHANKRCTAGKAGPAGNHCPLCHQNCGPYDTGWRYHLLRECADNPRNKNLPNEVLESLDNQDISSGSLDRSPPSSKPGSYSMDPQYVDRKRRTSNAKVATDTPRSGLSQKSSQSASLNTSRDTSRTSTDRSRRDVTAAPKPTSRGPTGPVRAQTRLADKPPAARVDIKGQPAADRAKPAGKPSSRIPQPRRRT